MPKKKSASSKKHQSFKMTPHNHPKERVLLYVVIAALIGIGIGMFLMNQYGQQLMIVQY